jgi:hypothetical protein
MRESERVRVGGVQVSRNAGFVDSEGLHCRLHAVVACCLPQEVDGEAVVDVRGRASTARVNFKRNLLVAGQLQNVPRALPVQAHVLQLQLVSRHKS